MRAVTVVRNRDLWFLKLVLIVFLPKTKKKFTTQKWTLTFLMQASLPYHFTFTPNHQNSDTFTSTDWLFIFRKSRIFKRWTLSFPGRLPWIYLWLKLCSFWNKKCIFCLNVPLFRAYIRSTITKGLVKYDGTPLIRKGKSATLALGLGSLSTSTWSGLFALLSGDF